jgi:hypothetical protein
MTEEKKTDFEAIMRRIKQQQIRNRRKQFYNAKRKRDLKQK